MKGIGPFNANFLSCIVHSYQILPQLLNTDLDIVKIKRVNFFETLV